jgi:DNA-binding YbaB/EbfC family protein|tara:strand:- start:908 stop:1219 length:312 start_codon:yes stop_codon:yes gene_type:complete
MPNMNKLMKQAQKMQRDMLKAQEKLSQKEFEISCGGGAVKITVNGQGEIKNLSLDEEFLKEDKEFVESTLLESITEAVSKSKEYQEEAMSSVTGGMGGLPGLM